MKIKHILILCILVITAVQLKAQKLSVVTGAEFSQIIPSGRLSERFQNTFSAAVFAGKQTSEKWTWYGRAEYMKFDKENMDKLILNKTELIGVKKVQFSAPLKDMELQLEIAGLSANARYRVFSSRFVDLNADMGFGVYRWTFKRNHIDSVSVDTSATSGVVKNFTILRNAPAASQNDWSGGFNAGLSAEIKLMEPLAISISANYKNILGELWPALALRMESVSSFQMFDLKAGIIYKF